MDFKKPIKSSVLKAGKKTYFFDVNLASNNKRYLKITESRLVEEGQPAKRSTIVLFPEEVVNFQLTVSEIAKFIDGQAAA